MRSKYQRMEGNHEIDIHTECEADAVEGKEIMI
jgi:hypothetical protein